jgi:hypothetical protein
MMQLVADAFCARLHPCALKQFAGSQSRIVLMSDVSIRISKAFIYFLLVRAGGKGNGRESVDMELTISLSMIDSAKVGVPKTGC